MNVSHRTFVSDVLDGSEGRHPEFSFGLFKGISTHGIPYSAADLLLRVCFAFLFPCASLLLNSAPCNQLPLTRIAGINAFGIILTVYLVVETNGKDLGAVRQRLREISMAGGVRKRNRGDGDQRPKHGAGADRGSLQGPPGEGIGRVEEGADGATA